MSKPRKPNPVTADQYQPAYDYIILEPEIEPEKTEGGIIRPEEYRNFLNEGKILKLGPDCPVFLKEGMFIVFSGSSEFRLDLGQKKIVFVVRATNIILHREDRLGKLFPLKEEPTVEKFERQSRQQAMVDPTITADSAKYRKFLHRID